MNRDIPNGHFGEVVRRHEKKEANIKELADRLEEALQIEDDREKQDVLSKMKKDLVDCVQGEPFSVFEKHMQEALLKGQFGSALGILKEALESIRKLHQPSRRYPSDIEIK